MQLAQDPHALLIMVFLNEISRTLRQPDQSHEKECRRDYLKGQGKAPLERAGI